MQELVPIRYGRMLVSPFTFYRGAAYPMAADLAGAPRTGLEVQLCGDAHLSNFGAFAASDRRLVFSINDFDETLPGPFEWDVKRLVASFAVAGRDREFDTRQRRSINRAAARAYREAIRAFGEMSNLDLWYSRIDLDEIAAFQAQHGSRKQRKQFERNVAKAQSKDSMRAFGKLTTVVNGERRIASDPPLIVPIEDVNVEGMAPGELEESVHGMFRSYRATLSPDRRQLLERYRYVHAARKVVGVGSVGTRAWIVLMLGRDDSDPLFLQLKEAQASVLEPFLGKSKFAKHGQRVVEGQRLTQAASDIMLGWIRATGAERHDPRLLRAPALGRQGLGRDRDDVPEDHAPLRGALRACARQGARPLRRRDRDRQLSRRGRQLRPCHGLVRGGVRRPERARLRGVARGRGVRPRRCRDDPLRRRHGVGPGDHRAHAARCRRRSRGGCRARRSRRRWCSSRSACWSGPRCSTGSTSRARAATVRTLAEATLAFVLFCDASRIDLGQLRREVGLPVRLLGIGLPLTIALGAVAAAAIFGELTVEEAVILAVVLAPTDAALGQAVVTEPRIPARIRQGLNVESGLNDGICVPLLFAAVAVADVESEISEGRGAGDAAARGDRLRGGRRGDRRARGRRDRHPRRPPRSDRRRVAAGDPGRRRGARLRDGGRAGRLGLHRGVRRGHDLPAWRSSAIPGTSTSSASTWATCSTASPSCSSAPSCSAPRSAS